MGRFVMVSGGLVNASDGARTLGPFGLFPLKIVQRILARAREENV
jgi:hypothetical protein